MILATRITGLLGGRVDSFQYSTLYVQRDSFSCGTLALLHMAAALGLPGLLMPNAVKALHLWLLRHSGSETFRAKGPADASALQQLAEFLVKHGVFPQAASERAQLVANKVGMTAIQQALNSRNPWAALKDKASQPGTSIRLVTHEELEAQIAARAKSKHGAHVPRAKDKKSRTVAPRISAEQLDVTMLQLDKSHFKDEDGDDIPQIQFNEVRSNGRGIAICTQADARAFIADPKSISTDALALLVLPPLPSEALASAKIISMRFPAVYGVHKEPMLIKALWFAWETSTFIGTMELQTPSWQCWTHLFSRWSSIEMSLNQLGISSLSIQCDISLSYCQLFNFVAVASAAQTAQSSIRLSMRRLTVPSKKFGPENSFPSPERLRILRMHASTSSISEWQLLLQIRSLNLR